ncbi:hypothetical protein SAMN02799630_00803 [Paenibacillus sp. UNCCL117]|nr:hypothetical protein SAMN04488602_101603 [Paenibacillus sp. cl123]SFW18721.1 hypothetical protein SAMN02799630_00803 [Paenibacillus sp. UNCCL117]
MVTLIIVISIVICLLVSALAIYTTSKSYSRKFYEEKDIDLNHSEVQEAHQGANQTSRQ